MNITVMGSGYVGLVTGACLADFGNDVICVDIDSQKIEALQNGKSPIYEPGLESIVVRNSAEGRLRFSTDLSRAIAASRVIFIAVGTPQGADGAADLRYVEQVAHTIARQIDSQKLIVTKSTVPVGTGAMIARIFEQHGSGHLASVASNPEFLREGSAIDDFMHPDRVVIGASDEESIALIKEIYAPLHAIHIPFLVTSVESAELIKYAANAFLATKISFINDIAVLCELVGGDVLDVAKGMGLDNRIGPRFLQAGPGYGGSCFPKDTAALIQIANAHGHRLEIVEAAMNVNTEVKQQAIKRVCDAAGDVSGKTIGILGLAFKPETDDMRDSPAITLIQGLQELGAQIRAYDPQAMANARVLLDGIEYCDDAYSTATGCDVLVIVTEWNEFRALNLARIRAEMRCNVIVDLRNVYEPRRMNEAGFAYTSIGRRTVLDRRPVVVRR
jgi:UDPglucose 6-dehydrogenase